MARGKAAEKGWIVTVGDTHLLVFAATKRAAITLATDDLGIDARLASHKELWAAGKNGTQAVQESTT